MQIAAMSDEEVTQAIEGLYRSNVVALSIVLTDGTVVSGVLSPEGALSRRGHLALAYSGLHCEYLLPLKDIAGLAPLAFEQERTSEEPFDRGSARGLFIRSSAEDGLWLTLHRAAMRRNYEIRRLEPPLPSARKIGRDADAAVRREAILWGRISFRADTPLYCDWSFLGRKSGGINNLGAGFMTVNISAGWTRSLWSSFEKATGVAATDFRSVCSRREAALKGYPVVPGVLRGRDWKSSAVGDVLRMEGGDWSALMLAPMRLRRLAQLERVDWVLAYFQNDSFMFPLELWKHMTQPIRVYGEIVTAQPRTRYGVRGCYLKARAAAFLLSDASNADD